ncbi:MAG TPA: PDDEXK nuclease domain-containing protein [Methanocorpusculum sp.]|nr:PDDEXK nuclease domain-containing protein [Methanocorpusculum sp.]
MSFENAADELDELEIVHLIQDIKQDIIRTRNRIFENANAELISIHFRIGKVISENARYGNRFIEELSAALKLEFPHASGFSRRNLSRMKRFYEEYKSFTILPPAVAKLPWTHNCILIDLVPDMRKRLWYAQKTLANGWSKVVLAHQIELELYERQADNSVKLTNFTEQLPALSGELAVDILKDPYIFELTGLGERVSERDIEDAMVERIKNVLLELGKGFSFVGQQYPVSTENRDYFIDLLFYHLELRCYVVVELKAVDFEPAFIGQLQFYVTAVDETLKKEWDNKTIGLLLCKKKDRLSVDWSLKSVNVPVGVASYKVMSYLPTEEEINRYAAFLEGEKKGDGSGI